MRFSLILNTRGRVVPLVNFLNSYFTTSNKAHESEVLIRIDNDDTETFAFYERQLKSHPYQNILLVKGERPTNLHDTLNWLARHSVGEYIFVLNDDVILEHKGWDDYAYDTLQAAQKPDGILYGRTHDNSVDKPPGSQYASFPIISRAGFNALGFVMHNDFVGLGGDNAIHRVYQAVDRVVDLPKVKIDHVFHNEISKIFNTDATAYHMRLNTAKNLVDPTTLDITKDINALQDKIYGK